MTLPADAEYDVIVVGGGNAAMCAALSARDKGASVLVLEMAPPEARGGNCPYTGGGFRFTHNGVNDLRPLLANPSELDGHAPEVQPYTAEEYRRDMLSRTGGRTDPDLLDTLISQSYSTVLWMAQKGIGFERGGSGARVGVGAVGSGPGLINMHYATARRHGVDIVYQTKMLRLLQGQQGP
jgi:tricarballylate dehydrogenase